MTTVLTHPDRTGRTASAAYRQMARRLNAEARKAELARRPLTAGLLRNQARIAMRAASAEELNEEPWGIGEFG